jgi:hypothetical protein
MSQNYGPKIVTDGLVICLDAANPKSYPGTGTTWFDLTKNNYNFTLSNSSAFVSNGGNGAQYMDLETYGCKYLPGGVLTDVEWFPNATVCIFSEIKNADGDWKTLLRSAAGDHQVIISSTDGISLGMYDNDAGGFLDTGFNMTTLPNYNTQFNFMAWKFSNVTPYYQFYYNENLSSSQATLTAAASTWQRGFASIGGYHNNSSVSTSFSQEFGKMSIFLYYNRQLTTAELQQNFAAYRGRYGL